MSKLTKTEINSLSDLATHQWGVQQNERGVFIKALPCNPEYCNVDHSDLVALAMPCGDFNLEHANAIAGMHNTAVKAANYWLYARERIAELKNINRKTIYANDPVMSSTNAIEQQTLSVVLDKLGFHE